jgi:heptosyltransferase-2
VEGNPYLDKIIIYDKDGQHKSWAGSFEFARELKKEKFDLALILHPTNRVHLVTFLAGIKKRVGYDRKMGFLLTDRLRHDKQTGQRHESEYSLDFARYLGIEAHNLRPFMPLKQSSQLLRGRILQDAGIGAGDRLLAVHPAASCRSKIWPVESFAEAADKLAQNYGLKVVIVAGPKDLSLAKELQKQMKHPALNLAGKCSVSELASILKECVLFISNDSGPVHIASALDVPVISIFGRNQAGLSPRRWGPLGDNSRVLHKEVGCVTCLAHNCIKEFACLKAVTVDDVLSAAASLLKA